MGDEVRKAADVVEMRVRDDQEVDHAVGPTRRSFDLRRDARVAGIALLLPRVGTVDQHVAVAEAQEGGVAVLLGPDVEQEDLVGHRLSVTV